MTDGEQTFDGMDRTTKVKFVGVQYNSLKADFPLGEEVEFKVRGRVVGVGDEEMKDAHVRHVVKVDVDSVVPLSFEEPPDPSVKVIDDGDGLFSDDGDAEDGDKD